MKIDWLWFAVGILFAMFLLPMIMGFFSKGKAQKGA